MNDLKQAHAMISETVGTKAGREALAARQYYSQQLSEANKRIALEAPLPKETSYYKPIPHSLLITDMKNEIEKKGFVINNEQYIANNAGTQLLMKYIINHAKDKELGFCFAAKNSYDKTMKISVASGAHVFICSNGMIVGDLTVNRKHTGGVMEEVIQLLDNTLEAVETKFDLLIDTKDGMKDIQVSKSIQGELIYDLLLEQDIIQASQIRLIKFSKDNIFYTKQKNSLWDFYNHITYSMAGLPASKYIQNHIDFHNSIVKEFPTLNN